MNNDYVLSTLDKYKIRYLEGQVPNNTNNTKTVMDNLEHEYFNVPVDSSIW